MGGFTVYIGYAHPLSSAGAYCILVASSPLSLFSLTGLRMHAETKVKPVDEASILVYIFLLWMNRPCYTLSRKKKNLM